MATIMRIYLSTFLPLSRNVVCKKSQKFKQLLKLWFQLSGSCSLKEWYTLRWFKHFKDLRKYKSVIQRPKKKRPIFLEKLHTVNEHYLAKKQWTTRTKFLIAVNNPYNSFYPNPSTHPPTHPSRNIVFDNQVVIQFFRARQILPKTISFL